MASQTQKLNFKNALLKGLDKSNPNSGNQTHLRQAGPDSIQKSQFLSRHNKHNKLLSDDDIQQLSDQSDVNKLKLRNVHLRILKLKEDLEELKKERNDLQEEVNSSDLQLDITTFLQKYGHVERGSFQWLHDHLIGPDCRSTNVNIERDGYKLSIRLYNMILTHSSHQENKDHSSLQLALHELRIGNVQQADSIALLIEDQAITAEYEHKKEHRRY